MVLPRISVALGTYNGEAFLEQQLESLARQTRAPYELVVCDDGSTDATVAIVEAFAERSAFPVRLFVNEANRGFAENFLHTASLCTGELVAFCDQDDVWLETKLERCAAAFRTPDVALAIHASRVVDERLVDTGAIFPHITASRIAPPLASERWYRLRGMGMVFSARLLSADWSVRPRSHYLADAMIHHDEWIYLLAHVGASIAFIDQPLALYRQHGANAVGAPGGRLAHRIGELRGAGWSYYRTRMRQSYESADLFARLAAAEEDGRLRARYGAGERYYRTLATSLEWRLAVYAPDAGAGARIRALSGLVAGSAYRGRGHGGFGPKAFVKDAAAAFVGWPK